MNTAFITDPLDSLDPSIDTSVGLMIAAQDRGVDVWVTDTRALEVVDGRARALADRMYLSPTERSDSHRWMVDDRWATVCERSWIWLDEMAAVFMRTEPPLNQDYVAATLILDLIDPMRTAMVNSPSGLRVCSEHLLPLRFPDLIPPTVVSAHAPTIRTFVEHHRVAIVKPVDGFGGQGVLRLEHLDPNLESLIEITTGRGRHVVVVQKFLPEVTDGNKRIFLVDGEPVGAVVRFPVEGDFRIGNPSAAASLTHRDREIIERLAPLLRAHGIRAAGLDVIGQHLIEVNITSPGALRKADGLLGWSLCSELLEVILRPHPWRSFS